ncbi:MAG: hypothetical protein NZ551_07510 [Microscillaceae bacterium]|nr:hypothetical protein [Microscillaceae bacterium]MDW8461042.1 hypothetical protein [Cytophagales bacterium]
MKSDRRERILKRNEIIRSKFNKLAAKRCYRIDYILQIISDETGMHPEYIRTIIKGTNPTENRLREEVKQIKPFENE